MASRRTLDDSDDEEATALELRAAPRAQQPSKAAPASASPSSPVVSSPALPSRAALTGRAAASSPEPRPVVTSTIGDDDDDDATEFLQARPPRRSPASLASPPSMPSPRAQAGATSHPSATNASPPPPGNAASHQRSSSSNLPASTEPAFRARGRAVSIGVDDERSVPNPPAPSVDRSVPPARGPGRDATEPIAVLDGVPRGARPLPGRSTLDDSATGTASVPRVTRIQVVQPTTNGTNEDDESAEEGADGIDAATMPLPPRAALRPPGASTAMPPAASTQPDPSRAFAATTDRMPPVAGDDATHSASGGERRAARAGTSTGDDQTGDGLLVVEVASDAVVFVNGVERGRGHVRVAELDRHARHAVRIHRPGFHSWSGSVSLDGRPAAKIRPTLKPRSR